MTNPAASVSFGRPYTGARPVKLSGYYKYEPHETNEGSVPSAEELPNVISISGCGMPMIMKSDSENLSVKKK